MMYSKRIFSVCDASLGSSSAFTIVKKLCERGWPTCHSMLNGWPRLIWMSGCEKRWRGGHGFVIDSLRVRERGALIQL